MPSDKVLQRKQQQVDDLANELKDAASIVFADYKGLTVAQDTEMRAEFRRQGLTYRVVKNSISERAFDKLGIEGLEETLLGPTAIAYSNDDVVLAPRLIREFSEKFKKIQLKGGIVNSEVKELDYIQALSHVESREKLYGKLLFLMLYPLTTFAQVAQLAADKGAEAGVETVADIPAGEAAAEEDAPAEDAPEEAAPAEETNEDAPAEDA